MSETGSLVIQLVDPLPCSIIKAENESGICGNPATTAHAWPNKNSRFTEWSIAGTWVLQPVCRECALAAASTYKDA